MKKVFLIFTTVILLPTFVFALPSFLGGTCTFSGILRKGSEAKEYYLAVNEGLGGGEVKFEFTGFDKELKPLLGKAVFVGMKVPSAVNVTSLKVTFLSIDKSSAKPLIYKNNRDFDRSCK